MPILLVKYMFLLLFIEVFLHAEKQGSPLTTKH